MELRLTTPAPSASLITDKLHREPVASVLDAGVKAEAAWNKASAARKGAIALEKVLIVDGSIIS